MVMEHGFTKRTSTTLFVDVFRKNYFFQYGWSKNNFEITYSMTMGNGFLAADDNVTRLFEWNVSVKITQLVERFHEPLVRDPEFDVQLQTMFFYSVGI